VNGGWVEGDDVDCVGCGSDVEGAGGCGDV
jgi:hypothetical protein